MARRSAPPLILIADGGGSKVCVVIRSEDGLEVRGTAGPCNVQSVGYSNAIQAILLATHRALSLLPSTHLPPSFSPIPCTSHHHPKPLPTHIGNGKLASLSLPSSPYASRPSSPPPATPLEPLDADMGKTFQYVWLAMAGITTGEDAEAFRKVASAGLGVSAERIKVTNDVNLLAAPALEIPGVKHAIAVVCGTGTVGRTVAITRPSVVAEGEGKGKARSLPLEDVGMSRGWGYMLCDEGSAFYLSRLALRSLLAYADRAHSSSLFSGPPPRTLPFHADLMSYFSAKDPLQTIEITALTGPLWSGLSLGDAQARRNALMAGAARVALRWAFPEDSTGLPSPPASEKQSPGGEDEADLAELSRKEALRLVRKSADCMVELILELLGDRTVVKGRGGETALCLGGGMWNSRGYREMVLEGLEREQVEWGSVVLVDDPAGVGARGLAAVEFGN